MDIEQINSLEKARLKIEKLEEDFNKKFSQMGEDFEDKFGFEVIK